VYAVDVDAEAKHAKAKDILAAAIGTRAGLTEQSIIEFVNAATRKAKLPLSVTIPYARDFLMNFKLLLPTKDVVEDVLALISRYKISIFDARIIAVCDAHGCDYLLSEDLQDNAIYGGVRVINPFNPLNANAVASLMRP